MDKKNDSRVMMPGWSIAHEGGSCKKRKQPQNNHRYTTLNTNEYKVGFFMKQSLTIAKEYQFQQSYAKRIRFEK